MQPKSRAFCKWHRTQYNDLFMFGNRSTYIDVTAPLRKLLRKSKPFWWEKTCQHTFEGIKEALCSKRVIAPWSPDRKTTLIVDRGPSRIAATLFQKNQKRDVSKTINYSIRTMTKNEKKNYSIFEGESLAILFGITKCHQDTYGCL